MTYVDSPIPPSAYHDYSVTWNQVKYLVDKLIDNHDERMAMGDIERKVKQAWNILYDDLRKMYGD